MGFIDIAILLEYNFYVLDRFSKNARYIVNQNLMKRIGKKIKRLLLGEIPDIPHFITALKS